MNRRVLGVLILFLAGATVAWSVMAAGGPRPRIITVDQLRNMLESSERGNMILVDVRVASSWASSDRKIVGAFRGDPDQIDVWASQLPKPRKLVFYCS